MENELLANGELGKYKQSLVERCLGAVMVIILLSYFLSIWWNRYLSPACGGELTGVFLYNHGMLPFRDYFASAPPGMMLLSVVIAKLFGNKLIAFWIFGAIFRILGAVVAFLWLCRIVHPVWSSFAVISTFLFASIDVADTPYFYNHIATNFAFLSAFALSEVFKGSSKKTFICGIIGGFLLACSLLVKQTTGIIASGSLIAITSLVIIKNQNWRKLSLTLASLCTGATIPVLSLLFWLHEKGILLIFLDQVFGRGPSSKGGAITSLLRPITITYSTILKFPALNAISLTIVGWLFYAWIKQTDKSSKFYWWLGVFAIPIAMLIGRNDYFFKVDLRLVFLIFAYLSMVGCLSICIWVVINLFLRYRKNSEHFNDLILIATAGFACAYALSISWPAFEVMIFPGATLIVALALNWVSSSPRCSTLFRSSLLIILLFLISAATARKCNIPWSWGEWTEPPLKTSTIESNLPELKGFKLSPLTANFLDEVTETIRTHSKPDERIFVYPNMTIFYGLAHRFPATFALMHWVDVCPDYVADIDAKNLLLSPPAVLVVHPIVPEEFKYLEWAFRNDQPSSVRKVQAAFESLYPKYQLIRTFRLPDYPTPIQIWTLIR